ncbi:MAG: hypothetical protein ACLP9K_05810 [Nitrososphaerales archaeon]
MTFTLKIIEWDDSGKKDASGSYQDTGPSIDIEMKSDTSRTQAFNLAKTLKRLAKSKLKIKLENSEEITEIK